MIWIWIAFIVIALFVWHRSDDEDPSKPSVDRALRAARTYDERRRSKR